MVYKKFEYEIARYAEKHLKKLADHPNPLARAILYKQKRYR